YTLNDPVNHLDPSGYFFRSLWRSLKKWVSGNKTLSLVVGSLLRFTPFPEMRLAGAAILFQSDTGRYILSAEIIAGTAAATFYCGGCGAAVGALTGEVLGGISALRSDGDVLAGVLFGGAVGAATGYLAAGIGPTDPGVTPSVGEEFMRGFVRGVGNGAADSFAGGRGTANSILLGAALGGVQGGALHAAYRAFVTFEVTWQPGGAAVAKEGLPTDMPVRGAVNVGLSVEKPGSCPTCEGAPLSMVLNQARGFNAISGMHDAIIARAAGIFQSAGAQGLAQGFLNYPMMLPAGALTYGTLLGGAPPSAFGLDER
ncbi:MAG: hypothetical protein HYS36_05900, partial [Candidatus Rokubacteria bacterium]|nr:hypothetical protein [Candidatus Rokubacteria bacterium]